MAKNLLKTNEWSLNILNQMKEWNAIFILTRLGKMIIEEKSTKNVYKNSMKS